MLTTNNLNSILTYQDTSGYTHTLLHTQRCIPFHKRSLMDKTALGLYCIVFVLV